MALSSMFGLGKLAFKETSPSTNQTSTMDNIVNSVKWNQIQANFVFTVGLFAFD